MNESTSPTENDPQPERPDVEPADEEQPDAEGDASLDESGQAVADELEEVKNQLLRVSADYQNFQRRTRQNIESARQEQLMGLARALVPVLDHFDRALGADAESTSAESLMEGMEMVRSELLRVLAGFDIEKIDVAPGDDFDPNRHEALMRTPSEDHPSDTVVEQLQPGSMLGDKTLRPAQVAVAE